MDTMRIPAAIITNLGLIWGPAASPSKNLMIPIEVFGCWTLDFFIFIVCTTEVLIFNLIIFCYN